MLIANILSNRCVTLGTRSRPLKTSYASRLLSKQGPEAVRQFADGRRTDDGRRRRTHTHQIFEALYTISPGGQLYQEISGYPDFVCY